MQYVYFHLLSYCLAGVWPLMPLCAEFWCRDLVSSLHSRDMWYDFPKTSLQSKML